MTSAETERVALAEPVYRDLLRSIICGDRKPGTRLKERELSELYSVSRVPVRQAIARLEAEGFALSEPRRGASVRTVSINDIHQLFDARLCIEPFATRIAARRVHAGTADPSRLERLLNESTRPFSSNDPAAGLQSNLAFHDEMVRLSDNALLIDFHQPMLGRMEWAFGLTHASREDSQTHEHQQLFEAVVSGNAELAAAQAYSHIELARAPTLAALESFLASPPLLGA